MNIPFADLKRQYHGIKPEIDRAIGDAIEHTEFIGGSLVRTFEQDFARAYGAKHCIGVANGTDAIYVCLKMLGIGVGDEVITTACSWISTSEAISQTGARPVFIDIDHDFLIDIRKIEEKISRRTKAILPVHLYGQMANMKELKLICGIHNLFLIEDCAQAHFAERDEMRAGLSGDISTFSFYPGKNLGAYGDAGAILTNDDELAVKCRRYSNHGSLVKHEHEMEGINSRLDSIQASILSVKLKYIGEWTEQRQKLAQEYFIQLQNVDQVKLPIVHIGSFPVYHLFVIRAKKRDELKSYLNEKNIQTSIHYPRPLPFLPCYNYLAINNNDFPVANTTSQEILSLPIFPELTLKELSYVCSSIKSFYD